MSRTPLDRSRVLSTAVALADRDGLDAVSMRTLAAELDVVPMALYKHVANKTDLVTAMIDEVVAGYAAPAGLDAEGLDARSAVRARILAARDALLAHPWLRPAIESATQQTPTILGYMNAVAGEFVRGGYSIDLTHHAMHALGHRIWGFSPEAFSSTPPPPAALTDEEQQAQFALMLEHYPHVTAIAIDAATRNPTGACDAQSEFEFTLDLLLDAFDRLAASGWQSTPK